MPTKDALLIHVAVVLTLAPAQPLVPVLVQLLHVDPSLVPVEVLPVHTVWLEVEPLGGNIWVLRLPDHRLAAETVLPS